MEISIKTLNDLLKNKSKYFKKQILGHPGEYNETFRFYQHPNLPENIFMRETYYTGSYGDDNVGFVEVQFVEGVKKEILVYEPV